LHGIAVTVPTKKPPVGGRSHRRDQLLALMLVWTWAGCAQEVTLVRDTPQGGLVTYTFQNDSDVLTSSHRREAMELIRQKCPAGSHIQKEGEVPKVSQAADRAWRGQMGGDRLWGIQFTCE